MEPEFNPPAPDSFSASFYDELPEGLSQEDRDLIYLHYEAGYPYQELADKLGCSPEAVGMRLLRARNRCRKLMETEPSGGRAKKRQKEGSFKEMEKILKTPLDLTEFDKYERQEV